MAELHGLRIRVRQYGARTLDLIVSHPTLSCDIAIVAEDGDVAAFLGKLIRECAEETARPTPYRTVAHVEPRTGGGG